MVTKKTIIMLSVLTLTLLTLGSAYSRFYIRNASAPPGPSSTIVQVQTNTTSITFSDFQYHFISTFGWRTVSIISTRIFIPAYWGWVVDGNLACQSTGASASVDSSCATYVGVGLVSFPVLGDHLYFLNQGQLTTVTVYLQK